MKKFLEKIKFLKLLKTNKIYFIFDVLLLDIIKV
jgi:hypothetical protein